MFMNRHVPRERIEAARRIPRGLRLLPNFVSGVQQSEIAVWIAGQVSWSCSGYCGNRRETYTPGHQPIPEWGEALGRRMHESGYFKGIPDQRFAFCCNPVTFMSCPVRRGAIGSTRSRSRRQTSFAGRFTRGLSVFR